MFVRLNRIYGQGRSNARVSLPVSIPAKARLTVNESEAKTAKSRNGYADWNVGASGPSSGHLQSRVTGVFADNQKESNVNITNEREEFEKCISVLGISAIYQGDGEYQFHSANQCWKVWQVRAALSTGEPAYLLAQAIVETAQRLGIINDALDSYSGPQIMHLLSCVEEEAKGKSQA